MRRSISRRDFMRAAAASTGMVLLAACGGNTNQANTGSKNQGAANGGTPQQMGLEAPPTEAPMATQSTGGTGGGSSAVATQGTSGGQTTAVSAQGTAPTLPVPKSFNESPKLSEQVKAGKLPKVEDRVGEEPVVLKPVEKVGTYGGTWHSGLQGTADTAWITRTMQYENLVRWAPSTHKFTLDEVVEGVAQSFEGNEDGTEYTFKLRKGMKWSDGHPFSADDIMFWYNDVFTNKDLTPLQTDWLVANDKPVKVEKKDDYTVVFKFTAPKGLFLQHLADIGGDYPTSYPAHYMKQFHIKYNKHANKEAKKLKMDDWIDLFGNKHNSVNNKDLPTLNAWVMTKPLGEGTSRVVAERNPYYWKVDTEGNQLPYIDTMNYEVIQKVNVLVLKALNGEIDMQDRHLNSLDNKSIFFKNQDKGHYHFYNETPAIMNNLMISLNLTTTDKVKNKVFNDKNFRIGLSYAINRPEILKVVFVSQGEPWQGAPRKESPFYNEKLAKQYTEYDTKKANEYLDKVLPKKNGQGMRLGPDGKPFAFSVETTVTPSGGTEVDILNMVKRYWHDVGIDIEIKDEERSLLYTRKAGNEHDAVTWQGDGGLAVLLECRWYFPQGGESNYAIPWANWYTHGGLQGKIEKKPDYPVQKPPKPAIKQMKLYEQIKATPNPDEQAKLMKQILDIAQEQFWCMGINLPVKGYGIVKNNFHNVPSMIKSYLYPTPAPTNTCQYFIDQS